MREEDFHGVWEMLSLRRLRDGVFARFPMGEHAWGRLIYAPGTMSAFIMSAGWRAGEALPPFENLVSYAARWSYADGVVRHQVLAASIPAWEGSVLLREAVPQTDGKLLLRTEAHVNKQGARVHDELLWQRVG
jgi:hypothetical protein